MTFLAVIMIMLLAGCSSAEQVTEGDDMEQSYTSISQEEARKMMAQDDGHIIVDVRRQNEYDAGHIPGAVLIPNESISDSRPDELTDPDQVILIYCRTGNRSRQAAQKLFDMGYTNVYEFGGIADWTGEIVTDDEGSEDASEGSLTDEDSTENVPMKISITDGKNTIIYQLNDSPSAISLYGMLPLDAEVENYGSSEKIFYPEQTIDTTDGIEGGGTAGSLALFSPWGNLVLYYDAFDPYPGLYILGEAVDGVEQVRNLSGKLHIEAVK